MKKLLKKMGYIRASGSFDTMELVVDVILIIGMGLVVTLMYILNN